MATLYLHVGRGKTGTTALQQQLTRYRSLLRQHDLHYLYADDGETGVGHQNFAKHFIANRPAFMKPPRRGASEIFEDVLEEIRSSAASRFLMSSENFIMADKKRLFEFFSELPNISDVRVILFVRSQDELAEAQYNQLVKLRGLTSSFQHFVDNDMDEVDFLGIASVFADLAGERNVVCRVFNAPANDLASTFFGCIAALDTWPPEVLRLPAEPANESLGYLALQLVRLLNGVEVPDRRTVYGRLTERTQPFDFPALLFDVEEARHYRRRFFNSNEEFSRRFLGEASPDLGGRRFDDIRRTEIRNLIHQARLHELFDAIVPVLSSFR